MVSRCVSILAGLLVVVRPQCFPGCGSATCPLDHSRFLSAGMLQVGLTYEFINQNQIYVGSSRSFVGAIPQHHDEVQTINQRTVVEAAYGVSERLSLSLRLPFVQREHSHIHHHQGEDLWEYWNFSALGDMVIQAQYRIPFDAGGSRSSVGFAGGTKLPTGVTRMKNSGGDEAEVTIQPGTGSLDWLFGLSARYASLTVPLPSGLYGTMPLTFSATYQINGKGTLGYRFGNVLLLHLGMEYPLARPAYFLFQINAHVQGFADVGTTDEPPENTGGKWVFLSPGFSVDLSENVRANAFVQLPVYRNVHGIQQTAPFNLQFGVNASVPLYE